MRSPPPLTAEGVAARKKAAGRAVFGALCLTLQPMLLNAISVPVVAYIIHRLGSEKYAQWMVATSLIAVCAVLTNLGLRSAFIRTVAAHPETAETALAEQLGLRLVLSLLAGVVVITCCVVLGYPSVVLWCAAAGAAGMVLTTFATTLSDLLQSLQRNSTLAAVNLVSGLALTALSAVIAWRGYGPIAMAVAYVSGPLISVVLLASIVRSRICPVRARSSLSSLRRLIAGSRFFAVQQLLFAGSSQIEALMLPRLIGLSSFGTFTAGAMPASRLIAIPDGLAAAAYPAMVSAFARGPAGGASLIRRYAAWCAVGGSLIAIVGMLCAEPLGQLLLPGQAQVFARVIQITIWSLPLTALELVMGYSLNACGKDAIQAKLAVPSSLASLCCSIALVSTFGLTGACWSMVLRPAVRGAFLLPATVRTFRTTREAPGAVDFSSTFSVAELRKAG